MASLYSKSQDAITSKRALFLWPDMGAWDAMWTSTVYASIAGCISLLSCDLYSYLTGQLSAEALKEMSPGLLIIAIMSMSANNDMGSVFIKNTSTEKLKRVSAPFLSALFSAALVFGASAGAGIRIGPGLFENPAAMTSIGLTTGLALFFSLGFYAHQRRSILTKQVQGLRDNLDVFFDKLLIQIEAGDIQGAEQEKIKEELLHACDVALNAKAKLQAAFIKLHPETHFGGHPGDLSATELNQITRIGLIKTTKFKAIETSFEKNQKDLALAKQLFEQGHFKEATKLACIKLQEYKNLVTRLRALIPNDEEGHAIFRELEGIAALHNH